VKLSLPLRIFLVHLVFMLGLGALGVVLVQRAFERYETAWEEQLEAVPAEKLFSPLAAELARSLLLKLEQGPSEPQAQVRSTVGAALDRVLPTMPSIEKLVIVDSDLGIQYAHRAGPLSRGFPDESYRALLTETATATRRLRLPSGDEVVETMIPVLEDGDEPGGRMGSVLVQYRVDRGPGTEVTDPSTLDPWAEEIARAMLDELRSAPAEVTADYKVRISEGLNRLISALPMERMIIVDRQHRIQYANDPQYLDLKFTDDQQVSLFSSPRPLRRPIELAPEKTGIEVMLPVFDRASAGAEETRLGSVLIHYRPDPGLVARIPALRPPSVVPRDYIEPLTIFLLAAVAGGILLAALTGVPVRRVERVLADYRARGYKGGLDPQQKGLPKDLASTVQAIRDLGGRLEALDEQGREREALLESLSQSLEDGMVAIDPSGDPVAWNPAALRILLGSEGPSPGHGEDAPRLREAIESSSEIQFMLGLAEGTQTHEVDVAHDDGRHTLARLTQVPVELRPGVAGTLLLLRDVGALRKVETHLLDAGRFAVLAHLAASLAHEIRNPLHAIQLNATVVEQYADTSGRSKNARAVADSLTTIKDEAQRLNELLNNYLGMVRPVSEAGLVDVRELSRKVLQLVDYAARRSHVTISLEGDEHPPLVQGVASRLQQAILNLVLNAIQAMPDGGTLTLHTSASVDMVRLTVSDTGPGLPEGMADRLFDTRVTTKPGGSGLGLPLVRLISEAHGGGVWYRSTPGKGVAFTMVLPAADSQSRPRAADRAS
jgi:signal transduction histidine kinase